MLLSRARFCFSFFPTGKLAGPAIEKLQKKLDGLERSQLIMKEVNAYYRKHGKLDGCALLSPDRSKS